MEEMDKQVITTLRILAAEAVEKANSGHPGLPLGAAPMAHVLWSRFLRHNPANSRWVDRDRFVLSAGHGSMLLYGLLHIHGYQVSLEDLKAFRQLGSNTPGHPEYHDTDGVETTTGPLGQGVANGVGMAIAESYLSHYFNEDGFPVVDHYTYVLAGDGCLMEGVSAEASSLAGTLQLGKLIMLYDSNEITIEGSTALAFRENVAARYEAYGWQVLQVSDGNNLKSLEQALEEAKKEKVRPSLIIVETIIGYGSPKKQGTASAHGEPLGQEEMIALREFYQWPHPPFHVPKVVEEFRDRMIAQGILQEEKWQKLFAAYQEKYPEKARQFLLWQEGPENMAEILDQDPVFWSLDKEMATREASGLCIGHLSVLFPNLMGGAADLAPSTKTYMKNRGDFAPENYGGANLRFGVREHGMAAVANGIALHGGLRTFAATFFTFTDYMKPAMRLSALMKLPVTYVLTHDSVGLGEDGPTHQPVEHLAALRSMPGMVTFRPADSRETVAGWYLAMTSRKAPVSLVLSRQKLPLLPGTGRGALRGAYILKDAAKPLLILMGTGSEVQLILEAANQLEGEGISVRVVSMPSFEIFEAQEASYKEQIFPGTLRKRLAVEAASSLGWHKYVGLDGQVLGLDHFGASGKAEEVFRAFGFTVENVVKKAKELLDT